MHDLFAPLPIENVIFSSYGNDSVALIQWAFRAKLKNVAVVFTDTGWSATGWMDRVYSCEKWVRKIGFMSFRTSSMGFRQLARDKKGFPTQRYQWCSFILKIEPGQKWLANHDPDAKALCLIGVRREESTERSEFPEYLASSENHGGRRMFAPFATYTEAQRNELIVEAGFTVLPWRSRECKCVNSNRKDMQRFTDDDWQDIVEIENEIGKPMFRPHRHMGAKGAAQVKEWANSARGKYEPPTGDGYPDEDMTGCKPGWCES